MKQVLQNLKSGETQLADVPAPSSSGNRITIQSTRTLISAGTEKMLVEFGKAGLIGKAKAQPEKVKQVLDKIRTDGLLPTLDAVFSKLGEPLPLGYCNAGTVQALGPQVKGFEIGDRVVSNGPHAEMVSVPPLLCAKIPDNVSDDQACFTVLASVGLQGIRLIEPTLGETVVVYGLGLIGLISVQLLRASGCRVIGIDINASRLALASDFGAETIHSTECPDVPAKIAALTGQRGADAVLITASAKTDSIISDSAKMCRQRGRVILVGVIGLNLNRSDFYEKEIRFQVSCSYGPGRYDPSYEMEGNDYPVGFVRWTEQRNFEAILNMLSSGLIDFAPLITHRFDIEQAPEAYATIQQSPEALGVVLQYPQSESANHSQSIRLHAGGPKPSSGPVVAAVVGAGNFTRATLMPALAKNSLTPKYVVGRSNAAAVQHLASKFNCEIATTDLAAVLEDETVNLVFVTTNHDSHAKLSCQALEAGKHVFVEKPLALNVEQLSRVLATQQQHPNQILTVGFNRRFSPHMEECRAALRGRTEPIAVNILMNAGEIPANHWVHDDQVGGGRIIGEACHMIDLLIYLTGSLVKSVSAHRMGTGPTIRDDKCSISLEMEDGSIASINYFANGSKSYPKETIEVFSEGRTLRVDNFRRTNGFGFANLKKFKTPRQDKGHAKQFQELLKAVVGNGQTIPLNETVNTTLASIAAMRAARNRSTIDLASELYPNLELASADP